MYFTVTTTKVKREASFLSLELHKDEVFNKTCSGTHILDDGSSPAPFTCF